MHVLWEWSRDHTLCAREQGLLGLAGDLIASALQPAPCDSWTDEAFEVLADRVGRGAIAPCADPTGVTTRFFPVAKRLWAWSEDGALDARVRGLLELASNLVGNTTALGVLGSDGALMPFADEALEVLAERMSSNE